MIVIYFSIWNTNFINLKGLFINQIFTSQGLLELWETGVELICSVLTGFFLYQVFI